MRTYLAVAAVATLLVSAGTEAATRCYSAAEIEADQAILFHTELMIISEACRDQTYHSFTRRNREAIIEYQQQMKEHFRRSGDRNAETSLDRYLTRLANQASLRTGKQGTTAFCASSVELVKHASALNKDDFRRYAATQAVSNRNKYKTCSN